MTSVYFFPSRIRQNKAIRCGDGTVRIFQEHRNPWERFLVLTQDELEKLHLFVTNDWIDETGRKITKADIRILEDFRIQVGDTVFSISESFTSDCGSFVARTRQDQTCEVVLWNDLWIPHRYRLYRPLVYFCSFGEAYMDTLELSLQSLSEFGHYEGDVLIVTDLDENILKASCPSMERFKCHVWNLHGQANLDFFATRFRIAEWKPLYQFSPLLYMDTDVVVDTDINDTPEKIFASKTMSAQVEAFTKMQNRSCLSHFDQSIANYIGVLTHSIDPTFLTEKVSYYWNDAIRTNDLQMSKRPQMLYTGFVHFWGTAKRTEAMSTYMQSIREASPFRE